MADGDDIEQKIELEFSTNADDVAKEVNALEKANIEVEESVIKLAKANKALADSSGKTKDEIKSLELNQRKAALAHKKAKEGLDDLTKSSKKSKGSLEDLGGGIGSTIKGFKGLIKQAWLLVANPIGLVIAAIALALTGLFKAFTSTKGGAEKFDQVMDGISATIDVVRDRVLKIAGAIAKFFSGDFAGAIQDGKDAVSGFGEEVAREFKIAADARKSLQEVTDAMRKLSVTRAELDRDLAESERILTSTTASYKEKKKALEEVEAAESKQTEAELKNARKKLAAIIAQNGQSDSGAEALDAKADAIIAVIELEKKSSENRRKVSEFNIKLDNEEKARKKQLVADDAAIEKQKEDDFKAYLDREKVRASDREKEEQRKQKEKDDATAEQQFLEDSLAEEERIEMEAEDRRLANAQKANDKQKDIDKTAAEKQADIDKTALEHKKSIENAKIGMLQKGIRLVADIFGKSKGIQKAAIIAKNAVGIGKMVIDNNAANVAALATPQAIATSGAAAAPVIALNNITTGIGVAASIAATAKALKSVGGGSPGGAPSSGGSAGRGASATPQVDFQASSENQIATTIADNTNKQPIVEAFVVESSITTAQALARNKIEANSFGN